jgi:hypothetical protein
MHRAKGMHHGLCGSLADFQSAMVLIRKLAGMTSRYRSLNADQTLRRPNPDLHGGVISGPSVKRTPMRPGAFQTT